jgi:hypothetical protein
LLSNSAKTTGENETNIIRLARRIERSRIVLNGYTRHWSAIKVRITGQLEESYFLITISLNTRRRCVNGI